MLQAGISTAMFLAPLGMTLGRMPFLYKYDKMGKESYALKL